MLKLHNCESLDFENLNGLILYIHIKIHNCENQLI